MLLCPKLDALCVRCVIILCVALCDMQNMGKGSADSQVTVYTGSRQGRDTMLFYIFRCLLFVFDTAFQSLWHHQSYSYSQILASNRVYPPREKLGGY